MTCESPVSEPSGVGTRDTTLSSLCESRLLRSPGSGTEGLARDAAARRTASIASTVVRAQIAAWHGKQAGNQMPSPPGVSTLPP